MKKINLENNFNINKEIKLLKQVEELKNMDININNISSIYLYLEEKQNCKDCTSLDKCKNGNKGYYHTLTNDFSLEECKFKKEKNKELGQKNLIEIMYLPKSLENACFNTFNLTTEKRINALKKANNFIINYKKNSFNKGLFLKGGYGVGKTYLLGCIANELAKKDVKSLLVFFPDLVRELKLSMHNKEEFNNIMNKLYTVEVLLIDDLGGESRSTFIRDEILASILNYRQANLLTTFISSNLEKEDLLEHFMIEGAIDKSKAARILSRILNLTEIVTVGD